MSLGAVSSRLTRLHVVAIAAVALAIFIALPDIRAKSYWMMLLFPVTTIISGASLWSALNVPAISRFLSRSPIVYLGKISFGLYIFHPAAISLTSRFVANTGSIP